MGFLLPTLNAGVNVGFGGLEAKQGIDQGDSPLYAGGRAATGILSSILGYTMGQVMGDDPFTLPMAMSTSTREVGYDAYDFLARKLGYTPASERTQTAGLPPNPLQGPNRSDRFKGDKSKTSTSTAGTVPAPEDTDEPVASDSRMQPQDSAVPSLETSKQDLYEMARARAVQSGKQEDLDLVRDLGLAMHAEHYKKQSPLNISDQTARAKSFLEREIA